VTSLGLKSGSLVWFRQARSHVRDVSPAGLNYPPDTPVVATGVMSGVRMPDPAAHNSRARVSLG